MKIRVTTLCTDGTSEPVTRLEDKANFNYLIDKKRCYESDPRYNILESTEKKLVVASGFRDKYQTIYEIL